MPQVLCHGQGTGLPATNQLSGRKSGVTCFISGAVSEFSCKASSVTERNTPVKQGAQETVRANTGGTVAFP